MENYGYKCVFWTMGVGRKEFTVFAPTVQRALEIAHSHYENCVMVAIKVLNSYIDLVEQ